MKAADMLKPLRRWRAAKAQKKLRQEQERLQAEAKGKFSIRSRGPRLYACVEGVPVLPLDMLAPEWQGRYGDIVQACRDAYVSYRNGED